MKYLAILPLLFLLSSCIYTEGMFVTEPQDVIVSPQVYQLTPWYPCHSTDVTDAERAIRCPTQN